MSNKENVYTIITVFTGWVQHLMTSKQAFMCKMCGVPFKITISLLRTSSVLNLMLFLETGRWDLTKKQKKPWMLYQTERETQAYLVKGQYCWIMCCAFRPNGWEVYFWLLLNYVTVRINLQFFQFHIVIIVNKYHMAWEIHGCWVQINPYSLCSMYCYVKMLHGPRFAARFD